MLESDEITKSLPPPRDDEPASLRQDIVDEIRDHIQCSLRRELLVGRGDETQARQRVLNKFGNPHVVARRLWFQAMWSRIMTQRLVIGSLVSLMMVSIALVVMVGFLMGRMDQQQRDQQAFHLALIEKMGSLIVPAAAAVPRDSNWNHLQIKVTVGTKDGAPARGIQVFGMRTPGFGEVMDYNPEPQPINVDSMGIADCGQVKSGHYEIIVITAWNERTTSNFTVAPRTDHIEQIVIPEQMPELTKVAVQVDGISPGHNRKQLLLIRFPSEGEREVHGRKWTPGPGEIVGNTTVVLAIDTDGTIWVAELPLEKLMEREHIWPPSLAQAAKWRPFDPTQEFDLPANRYGLAFNLVNLRSEVTMSDPNWRSSIVTNTHQPLHPENFGDADWSLLKLAANAGKLNQWTITIPKALLEIEKPW